MQSMHSTSSIVSNLSTSTTNDTASDNTGAGRVLTGFGTNVFSGAGLLLERGLGKLAYRAGLGSVAKAVTNLQKLGPESDNLRPEKTEEICDILLSYARYVSVRYGDITVADTWFLKVRTTLSSSVWPSSVFCTIPSTFRLCGRPASSRQAVRNAENPSTLAIFSWKRPGIDYSEGWLYLYGLVSRRLSTESNPVTDALAKDDYSAETSFNFSQF